MAMFKGDTQIKMASLALKINAAIFLRSLASHLDSGAALVWP